MRRSEDGWNGCKTKRVDCLSDVCGFNRLDRGKTVEEGKNRRILHANRTKSSVRKQQITVKTTPANDQSRLYETSEFPIQTKQPKIVLSGSVGSTSDSLRD